MSALAELVSSRGMKVSGSDISESSITKRLSVKGIIVHKEHSGENLGTAGAVVYSSAVSRDNPELVAAEKRGIPLMHRSDLLKMLMDAGTGITVAGTHGKSTVTAMLATILEAAGESPSLVSGAEISGLGSSFLAGKGRFFVAEADESDRSFLKYSPWAGIVTNIDSDHLNNYLDLEDIKKAFLSHLNSISADGVAVFCLDDPNLRELLPSIRKRFITYGLNEGADCRAVDIIQQRMNTSFTIVQESVPIGRITLPMPGEVNVLNALAASTLCLDLGISFETISSALNSFTGLSRRMEFKGKADDIWILDDYAHHPTEIQEALKALRPLGRRILLLFQPHRYTRTRHLLHELALSFREADELLLLPIYSAGEKPVEENLSGQLAREIEKYRPVTYLSSAGKALDFLIKTAIPGDLVVTMGAGDVWKTGEAFLEKKN